MAEAYKIRLAARCEAAGRPENEDNFQVAEDLAVSNVGFTTDKIFSLGDKGTLLLVCDGMGGMNAGEVASAVGVATIKDLFAPKCLTAEVIANNESVCAYMKRAIVKADSRIKEEASKDDAKRGMGSTAVMAWLLGNKVYVAWCGDSRCYRYNPSTGLEQLSHDHSYVQDLVDTGQLAPELAFDHPNKNVITRSLGDPRGAARPDAKVFELKVGDVILLCSDGLSDSLRDNEIEQSIKRSLGSMEACRDALWNDSKQAGWHDNVTIVLAQVVDEKTAQMQTQAAPRPEQKSEPSPTPKQESPLKKNTPVETPVSASVKKTKSKKKIWIILVSVLTALLLASGALYLFLRPDNKKLEKEKYETLVGKYHDGINFSKLPKHQVRDSVRSVKDDIIWIEKYEDKHKINAGKCKATNLKNKFDEAVQKKVISLRRGDSNSKEATEIQELKFK